MLDQPALALGPRLARLVVMDETPLIAEARALIDEQSPAAYRDPVIDLIETIIVYKFPQLSRAEIQAMLHLPETDLKKTRFYQEVFREGEEIGAQRGHQQGVQQGVRQGVQQGQLFMVLRLLKRRLGSLTAGAGAAGRAPVCRRPGNARRGPAGFQPGVRPGHLVAGSALKVRGEGRGQVLPCS